jgi:anti-sigma regulatory factor (Ser/Thr protein kinase)
VYLEDGAAPPLGVTERASFAETTHHLGAGATLLLYTDGLVERRRESIQLGLDRLRRHAERYEAYDVGELCDHVVSSLIDGDDVADDIVLMALRPTPCVSGQLSLTLPAEPRMLGDVRRALRQWLRATAVADDDANDVLVACGEACANVVRHAYPAAAGDMVLSARVTDGVLEVTVSDHGRWRPPAARGGGWGLQLIRGLMDTVDLDRGQNGTVVRMRRTLQSGRADL